LFKFRLVYGFVQLKDKLIDYPIYKQNFIKFLKKIYASDIISDKLYELYLGTFDSV